MALCKFGHFKLISKISQKVFELAYVIRPDIVGTYRYWAPKYESRPTDQNFWREHFPITVFRQPTIYIITKKEQNSGRYCLTYNTLANKTFPHLRCWKSFLPLKLIFFLPWKNLPIWDPSLPTKNCRSPYLVPRKYHMYKQGAWDLVSW